jgi:hypothetical protein
MTTARSVLGCYNTGLVGSNPTYVCVLSLWDGLILLANEFHQLTIRLIFRELILNWNWVKGPNQYVFVFYSNTGKEFPLE